VFDRTGCAQLLQKVFQYLSSQFLLGNSFTSIQAENLSDSCRFSSKFYIQNLTYSISLYYYYYYYYEDDDDDDEDDNVRNDYDGSEMKVFARHKAL